MESSKLFLEVEMIGTFVSPASLTEIASNLAIVVLLILLIVSQLMNYKESNGLNVRILLTFSIPLIALFVVVAIVRIINIVA
jgi:hypothetical protein